MKVADAVGEFLALHVKHVFCVSGGASLHLIHGIAKAKGITYVCPQHEQAAGFAADSYARLTGMGCALATSGPGATNLITAIGASYYDSVPVLYLTGQVTKARMSPKGTVRQTGFQETPIVEIVHPITKYAFTVMEPQWVIPCLRLAILVAKANRPGPVLVDIPDDIQRAELP